MKSVAELEWPSGIQCHACYVQQGWSWVWAPNLCQCLLTCLQVCGSKRLGCHADLYTVSRCHTRGESEDYISEEACKKGSILALKPRADITRSRKQGYQWPKFANKKVSVSQESWACIGQGHTCSSRRKRGTPNRRCRRWYASCSHAGGVSCLAILVVSTVVGQWITKSLVFGVDVVY